MKSIAVIALLLCAAPAASEVVKASPTGFEVRYSVNLVVPPEVAWAAFANLGGWWGKDHTYSGNSANLRLTLNPGGCFCERFPDGGGIEHMRVTYVEPGKRAVMTGSLGPLLYEATAGVMDVQVKRIAGGSQLTLNYRAAGFANGGAEKLAPLVDGVLADQMRRYRTFASARPKG